MKSFVVFRWIKTKPERITLGRYPNLSIEQARNKAAEVNSMFALGQNPNDRRRAERAEVTLRSLFEEYLERYAKLHKRSWQTDEGNFNRYLSGSWGKRQISSITKIDIQNLHNQIGRQKGIYTANRLLALLSTMYNKAIEFGLWDKVNPVLGIKKFREQSRDRFLQADELPRFFQALANETNDTLRDYIILSLLTGARRANVLSMEWPHIDFNRCEWNISQTKNGTPQTIPLGAEAIDLLLKRQKEASVNYVFPGNGATGHLVEPKKGWARILERAGITNLRIHDLRRTLGSWQARSGSSLAIIGKSLNHKSPQATAIYARLDIDPVRASVEKATQAMLMTAGIKKSV